MYKLLKCGKPYNDKSRSIIYNLTDSKNTEPVLRLLLGIIEPEKFVTIDPKKLASSKMKKEREDMLLKGLWNKRTDWDQVLV